MCMNQFNLAILESEPEMDLNEESFSAMQAIGLVTVALTTISLGLYIGREIRFRYKFRRRTPSDFFSYAGDSVAAAEYGMGV